MSFAEKEWSFSAEQFSSSEARRAIKMREVRGCGAGRPASKGEN